MPAACANDRDRFVLARREHRPYRDPWRHQGVIVEDERTAEGRIERSATVFLTGRECPWRCVMCDLWRQTIEPDTPRGAIPTQIAAARAELRARAESITQSKMYNAGSFFDPGAVPEDDYGAVAELVADVGRVVVESHPALVGRRLDRFLEALHRSGETRPASGRLEVAMGLETVHAEALDRLNKRMTVDDFVAAAAALDFDHALVREAESAGAIYLDDTRVDRVRLEAPVTLECTRAGRSVRISAEFLVDASGPRGFLHRALGLEDAPLAWLQPTQGLYTHFENVACWDDLLPPDEEPPYPREAALVRAADGAAAWERLLARLPSVREQFRDARAVHPFIHAPRLAFRARMTCGDNWAMLPSAAGVIDPLLSTGFPLTLLGIARLLAVIGNISKRQRHAALAAYAHETIRELDATEQLVAALYANMADVPLFKRLSLLYFAAASYSEAARRLGASGARARISPQCAPAIWH